MLQMEKREVIYDINVEFGQNKLTVLDLSWHDHNIIQSIKNRKCNATLHHCYYLHGTKNMKTSHLNERCYP